MRLKNKGLRLNTLGAVILMVICQGCGVYSFTGASIAPDVKTISIQNFYNDSGGGPPSLSQNFTEELKDYYQQNTNLQLVDDEGDLQLEGSIVTYNTSPVAPVASSSDNVPDEPGATRLTIYVKVNYVNNKNEKESFSRTFQFYDDFDSQTSTLTAEEDRLIETIFERIIYDIFNATVANW